LFDIPFECISVVDCYTTIDGQGEEGDHISLVVDDTPLNLLKQFLELDCSLITPNDLSFCSNPCFALNGVCVSECPIGWVGSAGKCYDNCDITNLDDDFVYTLECVESGCILWDTYRCHYSCSFYNGVTPTRKEDCGMSNGKIVETVDMPCVWMGVDSGDGDGGDDNGDGGDDNGDDSGESDEVTLGSCISYSLIGCNDFKRVEDCAGREGSHLDGACEWVEGIGCGFKPCSGFVTTTETVEGEIKCSLYFGDECFWLLDLGMVTGRCVKKKSIKFCNEFKEGLQCSEGFDDGSFVIEDSPCYWKDDECVHFEKKKVNFLLIGVIIGGLLVIIVVIIIIVVIYRRLKKKNNNKKK
jgi:hypothetical protein